MPRKINVLDTSISLCSSENMYIGKIISWIHKTFKFISGKCTFHYSFWSKILFLGLMSSPIFHDLDKNRALCLIQGTHIYFFNA